MKQIETNFDYSMMRVFNNCRRRYYYPYVLSIVPVKTTGYLPGAMEFGSALDYGLDLAYQILALPRASQQKFFEECIKDAAYRPERMQTLARVAAINGFKEYWGRVVNKGYTEELGVSLLAEYFDRWFPEAFDTIDSQVSGPVPIHDYEKYELNLMIKSDRLVFGYDPNMYSVFEVKSTGNPNDVWWVGMDMSYQTDGYVLGIESYTGLTIHSAVIDVIATKAAKGKTRTDRRPIIMSRQRRNLYHRWLKETTAEIMRLQVETMARFGHFGSTISEACMKATHAGGKPHDIWLDNRDNCTHYYRECEYRNLCLNDCHPGALSLYEENPWRPYMVKE